jgi:hypothetical protein
MLGWKSFISKNLFYTSLFALFALLSVYLSLENIKKERTISKLEQENQRLKEELKDCINVCNAQEKYFSSENENVNTYFSKK